MELNCMVHIYINYVYRYLYARKVAKSSSKFNFKASIVQKWLKIKHRKDFQIPDGNFRDVALTLVQTLETSESLV